MAFLRVSSSAPTRAPAYVCPMHLEVRRPGPGDCPVCGMALVATGRAEDLERPAGAARLSLPPGSLEIALRRILTERRTVPAWVDSGRRVQALVPEEEVPHLLSGERAEFRAGADAVPTTVRRTATPAVPHDQQTWQAEFEPLPGSMLAGGTAGWLALGDRRHPALIIPSSAVLTSPEGFAVLVAVRGDGALEKRAVRLGQAPDGLAVVLSGVEENERVVVRGAFFLEAERRSGLSSSAPGR